jgi:hypothetical protein
MTSYTERSSIRRSSGCAHSLTVLIASGKRALNSIDSFSRLQEPYATSRSTTWKFLVGAHGRTIPLSTQREVINTFAYMDFLGDISLQSPDVEIGVFEEYVHGEMKTERGRSLGEMRRVWMGRKVSFPPREKGERGS